MPTARAPRGAKPLIDKVLALIEEFPLPKQLEVATWLSGQIRTNIAPDLRRMAKLAAKTAAVATRGARNPTSRSPMLATKRSLAGKKAAATRKARGTQRGGRPARTNSEAHTGIEATNMASQASA